jgi:naphthoate synthase
MDFAEITYQEDGPIGTLTLNRPQDGNMFTPRMCHEIRDCINEVRRETRTRVLVITGEGKAFCSGADLKAGLITTLKREKQHTHSKDGIKLLVATMDLVQQTINRM